jgi:hypothetical protein
MSATTQSRLSGAGRPAAAPEIFCDPPQAALSAVNGSYSGPLGTLGVQALPSTRLIQRPTAPLPRVVDRDDFYRAANFIHPDFAIADHDALVAGEQLFRTAGVSIPESIMPASELPISARKTGGRVGLADLCRGAQR